MTDREGIYMGDLKTYKEWCKIFCEEGPGTKIMDDDGGRALYSEGRLDEPLTRQEAFQYFCHCTVMFNAKAFEERKRNKED
jgi:hypothetical protein